MFPTLSQKQPCRFPCSSSVATWRERTGHGQSLADFLSTGWSLASATAAEISSNTTEHPLFPLIIQRWPRALSVGKPGSCVGSAETELGGLEEEATTFGTVNPHMDYGPFLRCISPGGTEEEERRLCSKSAAYKALSPHCTATQDKALQSTWVTSAQAFFPLLLWAEILKGASRSHVTKFNDFEFSYWPE